MLDRAGCAGVPSRGIGVKAMSLSARFFLAAVLLAIPGAVAPALAQPKPAPTQSQELLKPEQLDQLVAPIAL
jgi:hypothetical protein